MEPLKQPQDKYNIVWVLCLIVGIGLLFPYNSSISAFDYFHYLFQPFPFIFALPVVENWSNMGVFLFILRFGKNFGKYHLFVSIVIALVVMFVLPIINITGFDKYTRIGMSLTIIFFLGGSMAVMISTTFKIVAVLPPEYTAAVMSGQGLAGLVTALLKICVNFWWFPDIEKNTTSLLTSGTLYFGIATIVMVIVFFSLWYMTNTDFYDYYQKSNLSVLSDFESNNNFRNEKLSRMEVFKRIWMEAVHVAHILLITLALFPGFTTRMRNYDKNNITDANFIVILITLFQFWDVVGRTLPKWFQFPSRKWIWIPVWVRLIYPVLFMLSVYTDYLPNNYIAYVVVSLFAITNGYFATLCMMYGPSNVPEMDTKTAGTIMPFCLQVGVFLGSHVAMILLFIIEGESAVIGN